MPICPNEAVELADPLIPPSVSIAPTVTLSCLKTTRSPSVYSFFPICIAAVFVLDAI